MQPKVSVIVPVYNAEAYLPDCLKSLASQTLDAIQVLLIDDGSTDRSAHICKDFTASHPHFEYYYKENGGTASARNLGLEHARGEYIGFVDSDDWIEPNMFETMYREAKNSDADILYCKMAGLTDYSDLPEKLYQGKDLTDIIFPAILPHVIDSGTFRTLDWGNWSRLFRCSMIQEHHIRFCGRSRRCEDFAFSVECALHANSYRILDAGELYHYRPNENSKSRSYTKNMWQSIRALMLYMTEITDACPRYDFSAGMDMCIFYFCTSVLRNEARLKDDAERIKKMQEVLSDPLCRDVVSRVSPIGMNPEYTALYTYIRRQDAPGLNRYLKQLAWKKKYVAPVLTRIFKNQTMKKLYQKIRRK